MPLSILELRLRLLDVVDKCDQVYHPSDVDTIRRMVEAIVDELPPAEAPTQSSLGRPRVTWIP